jgi:hypothetical protein
MAGREISYCAIVLSEKTLSPEKRKDTKHNIIWLPKNLEEEKERDITLRRAKRAKREREDPSGDYQQFRSSDEPLVLLLNNPPRGRNVPWGWRPPFILSDWPVLPCHLSLRLRERERKKRNERECWFQVYLLPPSRSAYITFQMLQIAHRWDFTLLFFSKKETPNSIYTSVRIYLITITSLDSYS